DILPHRAKMERRELDKEYKDADNPFRVVFVCAMWMTGFDVKPLSCLYLDKPLKAHTLMQAIARANRVSEGKSNGLIIDYVGIVRALKKALNDYTQEKGGGGGADPTNDKEELIRHLETSVEKAKQILSEQGFVLAALVAAKNFEKLERIADGAEAVSVTQETKKAFMTCAGEIGKCIKYLDRNDISPELHDEAEAIRAIDRALRRKRRHADTTDLMVEVNRIINENIAVEESDAASTQFDISGIDFNILRAEFAKAKHQRLRLKDLESLIADRINRLMAVNPTRVDFYRRYMKIIEEYNANQDRSAIEKAFMDLMDLARKMTEEEQRYIREGFASDEELSVYDILFSESLTKADIKKIKTLAIELLQKVKARIAQMDHWREKEETRAQVSNLIRDTLFEELSDSVFPKREEYRRALYEHIYTHYPDVA
ncbi:MAG: type I restriction endonuclease subunit R, partial [Schwartzia sp.]|nr:type I restriction endonuclease subunit R [Schwartzia sp. (in: firmicutes)]